METNGKRRATLTLPSDRQILVVREFDAPRAWVFDAWANPEWVQRWYGCGALEMSICEMDVREGGKWRWGQRDPATGIDHVLSGEYRQIARAERLVFTQRYEPIPGSDHIVDLAFEERGGVTTMTMRIVHHTAEMRDGHLNSGMEAGLQTGLDRIDEVLATRAKAA